MELVLKLNDQLRETEKELDTLIQLRQSDIATTSATIIPIVSTTIPSTLAMSLASIPTTQPVSTESTSTVDASREEVAKLVIAMEEMSIQAIEMNKLKEKVTSLETDCKLAKIMHKDRCKKPPE